MKSHFELTVCYGVGESPSKPLVGVKAFIRKGVGPESDAKESEEEDGIHFDWGFVVNRRKRQEVKETL